ncbi:MAG: type VI secretion system tip protein VgrG [Nannocystaceae bacterium]|nr:type VI secretion system tip protein VgrG [Nannocystaceae bacterium]
MQIAQTGAQLAQTGLDIAERIVGALERRLEIVHYRVHVIGGPDPGWEVRRFHLGEGLSQCYELVLDLLTADATAATDELLGADLELEIERGELLRTIYGVIHRVDYVGITADKLLVRVHVAPAFRLLSQQVNTRIFQHCTVLEILEQVLAPGFEPYGRVYDAALHQLADASIYPKRDYCVQYNESDFDFVSRLLEEEGIAYAFVHDTEAKKESLVLHDNNDGYPDVQVLGDPSVPIIADRPETADRESLRFLEWSLPEQINRVVAWHYNWKVAGEPTWPVQPLDATAPPEDAPAPPRGRVRELYLHGDRRKVVDADGDDGFDGSAVDELAPLVQRRLELFARQSERGHGRANVTGFAAGVRFELHNHTRPDLERTYLVTRVIHTGDCSDTDRLQGGGGGERYENSFECIPVERAFRPALVTRRPRVPGPTTAIVTGPPNEEIHVDAFGRIKIKFPWDRLGATDDSATCWVRVAQSWAGPGWGAMFIPRIGMEVVVEFLEGNPDRPLVTGCVYNAFTSTPFPLPDAKTKTTIKTQSSPDKQGYNELTFEDLAGEEQIIVHAQKDLNEKVENNHSLGVGADQSYAVTKNQTITVGGDQKITVDGSQFITVKGQPAQGGFKGSSTAVTGHLKMTASDTAYVSAPNKITLECPGSSITLEPGKISITAGGHATIVLDANALMKSAAGSKIFLDGNALAKSSGGSQVLLDGNALVQSNGGAKVLLDGNALTQGSGGGKVLCDGDVAASGAKVSVTSTAGGGGEFTADVKIGGATTKVTGGTALELSSPASKLVGTGECVVSGGVVKIN